MNEPGRRVYLAGLILLTTIAFATRTFGQATEGSILGTVTDASDAAVAGATVTVASVQTNIARTSVTNDVGEFVVTNLPLGSYVVSAELSGFKKAVVLSRIRPAR